MHTKHVFNRKRADIIFLLGGGGVYIIFMSTSL